jgi:hypothetical protein
MADADENDLYEAVNAMADRIGMNDPKERQRYVHEHMTRAGYDAVPTYVRREEENDDSSSQSGGFFGGRSRRPAPDRPRRERPSATEDWYNG